MIAFYYMPMMIVQKMSIVAAPKMFEVVSKMATFETLFAPATVLLIKISVINLISAR